MLNSLSTEISQLAFVNELPSQFGLTSIGLDIGIPSCIPALYFSVHRPQNGSHWGKLSSINQINTIHLMDWPLILWLWEHSYSFVYVQNEVPSQTIPNWIYVKLRIGMQSVTADFGLLQRKWKYSLHHGYLCYTMEVEPPWLYWDYSHI